jgi:hypothetical protein
MAASMLVAILVALLATSPLCIDAGGSGMNFTAMITLPGDRGAYGSLGLTKRRNLRGSTSCFPVRLSRHKNGTISRENIGFYYLFFTFLCLSLCSCILLDQISDAQYCTGPVRDYYTWVATCPASSLPYLGFNAYGDTGAFFSRFSRPVPLRTGPELFFELVARFI